MNYKEGDVLIWNKETFSGQIAIICKYEEVGFYYKIVKNPPVVESGFNWIGRTYVLGHREIENWVEETTVKASDNYAKIINILYG